MSDKAASSHASVRLLDVVITHELLNRPARRKCSYGAEEAGLTEIAKELTNGSNAVLHVICKVARRLCETGSAGINMLVGEGADRKFEWVAIDGCLAGFQGGHAPADHSPCGFTVQRKSAQLLSQADRYFGGTEVLNVPVFETLIVPLFDHNELAVGTIWAVAHDKDRHFDMADLTALSTLSSHATAALKLHAKVYQVLR